MRKNFGIIALQTLVLIPLCLMIACSDDRVAPAGSVSAFIPTPTGGIQGGTTACDAPQLDTSFGVGGKAIGSGNGSFLGRKLVLQSDGKIVVAGSQALTKQKSNFMVARFTTSGTLDSTFGITGIVSTPIGTSLDDIYAITLQADGKVVVAGRTVSTRPSTSLAGNASAFAVARYNVDGSLDSTFNHTGIVVTQLGTGDDQATGVAIDASGNIIVAGMSVQAGTSYDFALVRYLTTGALDTSFGTGGVITTNVSPKSGVDFSEGVAIQANGKIVVVGTSYDGPAGVTGAVGAMTRYNANGSLDSTFGKAGILLFSAMRFFDAIRIQSDGKLLVGGYSSLLSGKQVSALARFNGTDGGADTAFGQAGLVQTATSDGVSHLFTDLQVLANGNIVAVTNSSTATTEVMRYDASGNLDSCLGMIGTPVNGPGDWNQGIAVQSDGAIVVGGHGIQSSQEVLSLVRYR